MEFMMAASNRRLSSKPEVNPTNQTERRRLDREPRNARNLALAYYIDGLVRSGEVADLAAVARLCGVSRALVSKVIRLLGIAAAKQGQLLCAAGSM